MHGAHVEYQKLTTMGLPVGTMVTSAPLAMSCISTKRNFFPLLLVLVPIPGVRLTPGSVRLAPVSSEDELLEHPAMTLANSTMSEVVTTTFFRLHCMYSGYEMPWDRYLLNGCDRSCLDGWAASWPTHSDNSSHVEFFSTPDAPRLFALESAREAFRLVGAL